MLLIIKEQIQENALNQENTLNQENALNLVLIFSFASFPFGGAI